ncbi:MAG TPA: lyase family protein, partial [Cytophagales bacterium]
MSLYAISPVDGRYHRQTAPLQPYFSEAGLIRYRVRVEIEYFIALCQLPLPQLANFPTEAFAGLRHLYEVFGEPDARAVKEIEQTTNHDVKAVEYFIKSRMEALGLGAFGEFIHFGLTSQDVNNTAIPLLLKEAMEREIWPVLRQVAARLDALAATWADVPMLARTHGQPASPTRLGKELKVFGERLARQLEALAAVPFAAKFGGAT